MGRLTPDCYTLALSYAIGSVSFTVDRYSQAYWAFGGSLNTSEIGGPPGISFTGSRIGAGLLDQPSGPILGPNDISSFVTGVAGNLSVGMIVGGGITFSPFSQAPNQFGTHSTVAFDAGVSTPFAGGSVTYGIQFKNEKVNAFAQNLLENVIVPLLP